MAHRLLQAVRRARSRPSVVLPDDRHEIDGPFVRRTHQAGMTLPGDLDLLLLRLLARPRRPEEPGVIFDRRGYPVSDDHPVAPWTD